MSAEKTLGEACKELRAAEQFYQRSLDAITEANVLAAKHFERVVACRKEVRRLSCVGHQLLDACGYGASE